MSDWQFYDTYIAKYILAKILIIAGFLRCDLTLHLQRLIEIVKVKLDVREGEAKFFICLNDQIMVVTFISSIIAMIVHLLTDYHE